MSFLKIMLFISLFIISSFTLNANDVLSIPEDDTFAEEEDNNTLDEETENEILNEDSQLDETTPQQEQDESIPAEVVINAILNN
jgi:hypothetical protein